MKVMATRAKDVLPVLPDLADVMRLLDIRSKKALAQHFLFNQQISRKLVHFGDISPGCHVVEVGPGPGTLTRQILKQGPNKVILIERDRRFIPMLDILNEQNGGIMDLYVGDVLNFDTEGLFDECPSLISTDWSQDDLPNVRLFGNLPFNISIPLLIKWLQQISLKSSFWKYGRVPMALTFQHEVSLRMAALPYSPLRCRLSFICQNYCDVKVKFIIKRQYFRPVPKVDAAMVYLVPKVEPDINVPYEVTDKFSRHLFMQRRKWCRSPVKTLFPRSLYFEVANMFAETKVDWQLRPFQLSMPMIKELCLYYNELCQKYPGLLEYAYTKPTQTEASQSLLDSLGDNS